MKDFFIKAFTKVKEFIITNKNELVKPTVVLLCICIIIPLALAVTNMVTVDRIARLEQKNSFETMKKLIAADNFNQKENKSEDFKYHEAVKNKEIIAYIFKTAAKGYGGEVSVMTAISPDGEVLNVAILDVSNETPGLGQNVTKKDFYSQFIGKNGKISIKDVDTVTGATFSSRAVTNAINEALADFKNIEIVKPDDNTSSENNVSETEETTSEAK